MIISLIASLFSLFITHTSSGTSFPSCVHLYKPFPLPSMSSTEAYLTTMALFPERTASYKSPALMGTFSSSSDLFSSSTLLTDRRETCLDVLRDCCSCREGSGGEGMRVPLGLDVALNAALRLGLLGGLRWKRVGGAAQQGDLKWIDVVNWISGSCSNIRCGL